MLRTFEESRLAVDGGINEQPVANSHEWVLFRVAGGGWGVRGVGGG